MRLCEIAVQCTLCLKTVQNYFCQNFVEFPPSVKIFGTKMAKRINLCKVNSFSTSPTVHLAECSIWIVLREKVDRSRIVDVDKLKTKMTLHNFEGVSNTITQLRFPGFCFSGTSLLGQWGQICFAVFLKTISCFFAQNFCTDRVDILLCSEANKRGGGSFSMKFGTFGQSKLVASATSTPTTPTTPSVRDTVYIGLQNYGDQWETYLRRELLYTCSRRNGRVL